MKVTFRNAALAWLSTAIVVITLSSPAIAAATACSNSIKYFYINGVSVDADRNRGIAADNIQMTLMQIGIITNEIVKPLQNPSGGLFIDVFVELVNQKLAEKSAADFADGVRKATLMLSGDPSYAASASERALAEAKIADFFNRAKNLPGTTAVTAGMINAVSATLNASDKAVIIAHSQGNMFANAILDAVTANRSPDLSVGLKIVSIATPAAFAQDLRYVTANQDRVINIMATGMSVMMAAPLPLSSNIDVPGALNYDLSGHGLLEVYLNPNLSVSGFVMSWVSDANNSAINPACGVTNITPQNSIIYVGDSYSLAGYSVNSIGVTTPISSLEWTSSNQSVATVVNGNVYGVSEGVSTITLRDAITGVSVTTEIAITQLPSGYIRQGRLVWSPNNFSWQVNLTDAAADSTCSHSNFLGRTGWRLPTQPEMSLLYSSVAVADYGWDLSRVWTLTFYPSYARYMDFDLSSGALSMQPGWHAFTCVNAS